MTSPILYATGATEYEFYEAIAERLKSSAMRLYTLAGALDTDQRAYTADDPLLANPPGNETEGRPWGRVIVVPIDVPLDSPGELARPLRFLVRCEVNDARESGARFPAILAGMQRETYRLLRGFIPSAGMANTIATQPIEALRPPQPLPSADEARGVVYTSSEWRAEVGAKLT